MSDWCDELDCPTVTAPPPSYNTQPSYRQYDSWGNDSSNGWHQSSSDSWRQNSANNFQHRRGRYNHNSNNDDSFSGRNEGYVKQSFHPRGRGGRRGGRGYGDHSDWRQPRRNQDWDSRQNPEEESCSSSQEGPPRLIDWDKIESQAIEMDKKLYGHLPPVKKVTYEESEAVAKLTPQQVKKIRQEKNSIAVSTIDGSAMEQPFNPVLSFEDAFERHPQIMSLIKNQNFTEPSPIQSQLWPILMSGYDAVGIAQTGTGKTLAYLLPGLLHIAVQTNFKAKQRTGPLMLVLGPTRELVQQIHQEVSKFNYKNMKSVCVYGQGSRNDQRKALLNMAEIVVATPGRLIDFVNSNIVDLKEVSYLVLDEADRMLDLGFQPDIIKVTSDIRPDRQTILTSATWPQDVEYIAKRLLTSPVKVQVGDLDLAAVSTVTQIVEVCEEDDKFEKLIEKLANLDSTDKVIVFSNKKATADFLINYLYESNIDSRVMHGGLEQYDREAALDDLKSGRCQVLCATDVASRGLDITDLTKVINLDLPKNLEEYVHRSGRTGRAGRTGLCISFVTWDNRQNAAELIKILERSNQVVPDDLRRLAERAQRFRERQQQNRDGGRGRGRRGRF